MQRLNGLDSMFLSAESATNLFQVGAIAVLDPTTAPAGSPSPHEGLRRVIEERLHLLDPFRRRVLPVPAGLDHPRWVEDEPPDLYRHVIASELRQPGHPGELARYTAEMLARPLDRSRPLWEIHVVDGLEGGLVAGVAKMHHSAIDGIIGAEVTGLLMDVSPEVASVDPPVTKTCGRVPSRAALLAEAAVAATWRVPTAARTLAPLPLALGRYALKNRRSPALPATSLFDAPKTTLSGRVSGRRAVGFVTVDRHDVDELRALSGATVNDVILALAAGALRDHLTEASSLPDRDLVAFVPVSLRGADGVARGSNHLSGRLVSLATTISDPLRRLQLVRDSSQSAKTRGDIIGHGLLSGLADLAVPALLGPANRLAHALGVTTRRPPFNVIVSSFAGPRFPLFCAGAELVAYHPFGPIIDGAALNITAMSYRDQIGFGVIACPDAVSDVDILTNRIPEAMRNLVKAAQRVATR